ncbi:hypothetical protein K2173_028383 [Erythroxylum novogranatense]|uniref:Hexosyltransferase n=1 Tax=Erythroxylum novogranatense TaxID=1862640 RepID=A0AAV8U309_9ROSI|nr:hypothetical protein K2173_028383 [Erythroxylum novogranatense]
MHTGSGGSTMVSGSRILTLVLSMFATLASFYVAGRFWQDSQNRVYLIKELHRITGQGQSAISVDDSLKIIACSEKEKKLTALRMELAAAKLEGFTSKFLTENDDVQSKKRHLLVIGIMTEFGNRNKRDAIRKAWMGTGSTLKKKEDERGIIARFVIGQSANRWDTLGRDIENENTQTNDFVILDNHVKELPKRAELFFVYAVEKWDAEFYAKVNDNIYVNIDALGNTLATHMDKPRVYIGCMKSGEVFSDRSNKWYEPEWWKFGDKKSYFRHASGDIYVISRALAKYISINRSILHTYAHDDVSAGSWFIGLDIKHVDEGKLCCLSRSSGAICAGV